MTPDEIRDQIKIFKLKGDQAWEKAESLQRIITLMRNSEITAITNWAKAEALEVVLRMKEAEQ